jgi:2-dehydropantoate 2-reductase
MLPLAKLTRLGALTAGFRGTASSSVGRTPAWLRSVLSGTPPTTLYAWNYQNIRSQSSPKRGNDTGIENRAIENEASNRIYILGIGNLGRLFATSLAQLRNCPPITLVVHKKHLLIDWLKQPYLEIWRNGSSQTFTNFDVEWWTDAPPDYGPPREVTNGLGIRNLIVSTKAADAVPQVDRLRRYLDAESTVAFTQNGMCKLWPPDGLTYLSARYSMLSPAAHPNFLACVTTHGVTSLGQFKSVHASPAGVVVGPVWLNPFTADRSQYLVDMITQAPYLVGQEVSRGQLWILQLEKLVVNSVINPLTAILRCKNGDLFLEPDSAVAKVIDLLVREASEVLTALVNHHDSSSILADMSDLSPQSTESYAMEDRDTATTTRHALLERLSQSRLSKMLNEVGFKVRENTSSMLQDVRAGKKTEIRDFNGWLVDTAVWLDQNLDVTTHKAIIDAVEKGLIVEKSSLGNYVPGVKMG